MFGKKRNLGSGASVGGDLAALSGRISSLEKSRDYLKKELMNLSADVKKLELRQAATVQFYEFRIDQIYQNILRRLPDTDHRVERSASKLLDTNPDWERLVFESQEPFMQSGLIPSPLTLSGFRLDTRRAIERLDHVELLAGVEGIALFGPYRKLRPGTYDVQFILRGPSSDCKVLVEAFTAYASVDRILATAMYIGDADRVTLSFDWPLELSDAEIEFRVHQLGMTAVKLSAVEIDYKG